MTNQPNKATVKDGLPTAHNALSDAYQRHGWLFQPDVLPSGACPHEKIAMEAMQEYSDQQNAELLAKIANLENSYAKFAKERDEQYGEYIDLNVSLRNENAELRERVKELEGQRKSDCIAFANWLSNQVLGGRSIEKLWRDYETEVLK